MSRSKNNGKSSRNRDLWGRGPMSGNTHCSAVKKIDRRIKRKDAKAELRREGGES